MCPRCSSSKVLPIVYGYPSEDLMAEAEAGKVRLGGCIVSPGDPDRACGECSHQWREERPDRDPAS